MDVLLEVSKQLLFRLPLHPCSQYLDRRSPERKVVFDEVRSLVNESRVWFGHTAESIYWEIYWHTT